MRTYSNFFKNCATCAYWCGSRETDYFGTNVKIQDDNAKGKCMAPLGKGWRGQDRTASMTCNGFKKWDVLRERIGDKGRFP